MKARQLLGLILCMGLVGCGEQATALRSTIDQAAPGALSERSRALNFHWSSTVPVDWDSPAMQTTRALAEAYALPEPVGEHLYPGFQEAYLSLSGDEESYSKAMLRGTEYFTVQHAEKFVHQGQEAVRVAVCDDYTNVSAKTEHETWALGSASPNIDWYIVTPPERGADDPLQSARATNSSQARERYPTWDIFNGHHIQASGRREVGVSLADHTALNDQCKAMEAPSDAPANDMPPGTWYPGWLRPEGA